MEFDKRRGHLLAVLQTHTGHRREKLHGYVRGDLAVAHLLLDSFRQQFDQRQPPRYPTHAAIKTPRQFIETIAEALLQLCQQPALLQRCFVCGETQRPVQYQGLGFAHRPEHRIDGVAAQLLERRDPLEAIDHQVAAGLVRYGDDHDGRLLAQGGERCQKPLLLERMVYPQVLPSPVELMKLQLHGGFGSTMGERASGLVRRIALVRWEGLWIQGDSAGTGLAWSAPGVHP